MPAPAPDFIIFPDPRLTQPAQAQPVDPELRAIGERLLEAALRVNAYGLAAAHLGIVAPVALVSIADPGARDYLLLYNPVIIATAGKEEIGPEGSVSMPGIEVAVSRPSTARIAFEDASGIREERELTGFAARVAQHEIDQVNGVFFLDRVSRLKRDTAIRRFAKLRARPT